MIWNTIAHPKMMIDSNPVGVAPHSDPDGPSFDPDDTTESVIEGIKYADPHKLAFFDLLVDVTDADNPKLIHGDFETVKNKILNHELVIYGKSSYDASSDGNLSGVSITIGVNVNYLKQQPEQMVMSFPDNRVRYILRSDNTISSHDNSSGGGGVVA